MSIAIHLFKPGTLEFESSFSVAEWRARGADIIATERGTPWNRGDWYLCGIEIAREQNDPRHELSDIQIAATAHKMAEFIMSNAEWKTCRNNASVCRMFQPSRRRDKLTFHHHEVLCSLNQREQNSWLDRCEESGMSVMDLRQKLRDKGQPKQTAVAVYFIEAEIARMMRWLKAQDLSNPERAAAVKSQLQPLVEFTKSL